MKISDKIIDYYYKNKRDLAWRSTKNPYLIWISEIMLQQTQVTQVKGYYQKFVKRFPDIFSLAYADEKEVLLYWQGLGYYSRARNLHFSAKYIVRKHNGVFPDNYQDIIKLKGIGEYTAAAIASIVFNETIPAIDGNVYRVLARIFNEKTNIYSNEGKKRFKELAKFMIENQPPGDFNQAMMELGATICKAANPACRICPVFEHCAALINNTVLKLPVNKKNLKVKNRYFQYLIIIDDKFSFLKKRKKNDIWKGLYDFPLVETKKILKPEKFFLNKEFIKLCGTTFELIYISDVIKHRLSHQLLHLRFYVLKKQDFCNTDEYVRLSLPDIKNFPMSKIIDDFVTDYILNSYLAQ